MPKLYELTAAYNHLDSLIDDTEMTNEQLLAYVETLEGALKDKGENIAKLIENLEATADAMKASETRLAARRKAIENRVQSIRSYLLTNMVNSGITKIECEYFKISVREGPPSVVVVDEGAVPADYFRVPEPPPPTIDKKKILDDTKQGVVIDGVQIDRKPFLSIR